MRRPRSGLKLVLRIISLTGLCVLVGCGGLQWPPGGEVPGLAKPPPRAQAPRPPSSPQSGKVTIAPGESLYTISERYGVSVRALIDANRLRPPYRLLARQRLAIPQARKHRVQRGETLYGISRRYRVNLFALARANQVLPPYHILAGQQLRIPYQATAGPEPTSRVASLPDGAVLNSGSKPTPTRKPRPRLKGDTGGGFIWPVQGRVVSGYGPKGKGLHNDGINILAPRGTPVRASENGVVVYAGNELRGFGNLLLIKHSGGLTTAYAHTQTMLVRRGDRVQRGQIVARVGSSGNVASPQLHFEIRRGRQAIDPRAQLRPFKTTSRRRISRLVPFSAVDES